MKSYESPVLVEFGAVAYLTAAFGTATRADISEFPSVPPRGGSVDVCDQVPNGNGCGGEPTFP